MVYTLKLSGSKVEDLENGGWILKKDVPELPKRKLKIEELEKRDTPNVAWGE